MATYKVYQFNQLLERFPELNLNTSGTQHNPKQLWILGNNIDLLSKVDRYGLAIVGTRGPTSRSIDLVHKIMSDVASRTLVSISGLALGIDTASHQISLKLGIPTIALLGCGLQSIYPRENQSLAHQIVESGGLVISEFEPQSPPLKWHFLRRNRLIAGWSKCTWIVEAPERSGTLNTAQWASTFNRTCYATSAFPSDPAFAGNLKLLESGSALPLYSSYPLLCEFIESVSNSKTPIVQKTKRQLTLRESKLVRAIQEHDFLSFEQGEDLARSLGMEPTDFFQFIERGMREKILKPHLFGFSANRTSLDSAL